MNKKSQEVVEIGKTIKFWRKINAMDQRTFAERVGTSRAYVAKIETGFVGISIEKISVIAAALGIKNHTLFRVQSEREIEILLDVYDDKDLNMSKYELECLWNQSIYTEPCINHENYVSLLWLLRSSIAVQDKIK